MLPLVSIYKMTMRKKDLWINVYITFGSDDHDGTGGQESEHDVQEIQHDFHEVLETKKKKKKKHKQ